MNIETILDQRLWQAVQSTYNDRNFTGAILDAIYCLSDLIREKTGLQSDGTALIGQAFGGKSPKLKVNKLQTESEKNIQAGVEQILRGFYQAIRNPRSHGKHEDKQGDADAIIMFINFLIDIIDQSKAPFTKSEFIKRVFDSHFVEKERYAQLLASEIPPKKRLEVMLEIFRNRETGDGKKLKYFVNALLPQLAKEDQVDFYATISEELNFADTDSAIRTILQIFPDCFIHLSEAARLRTENKLIECIGQGLYNKKTRKCSAGALGTWAMHCCKQFLLKDDLVKTLTNKLKSDYPEQYEYVFNFFWDDLIELTQPIPPFLKYTIQTKLKAGNKDFYHKIDFEKQYGASDWAKAFEEELESFKEKSEETFADDEVPF